MDCPMTILVLTPSIGGHLLTASLDEDDRVMVA
jgi:hypothetical protein